MKKTYTISIGGQIFHTEEDAGDKLQAYIQTLEKHYFRRLYGNSKRKNAPETLSRFRSQYAGRSSRRYC